MADIKELLKKRILLLDGGMGTVLQKENLTKKDFDGKEGCNEVLNLTRPDVIQKVHEAYLEAGSDIIETNSFSASSITLAEYGLEKKDYEINLAAAKIARKAADKFSTKDKPRFVAGSIGPTNKTISVTSNITFEELEESYYTQAKALMEGKADLFLIETVFDTLNAKAAFSAIDKLFKEKKEQLPMMLSATIEKNGTMLAGQNIESFYISMEHNNLLAIGMNCGIGPDLMKSHLRNLTKIARTNIICYANAGLPLADGTFPQKPKQFANLIKEFIGNKWINLIGGCCGTTPEHIKEISKIIDHKKLRKVSKKTMTAVSGLESVYFQEDNRPLIVGERTNTIGSRKFKELLSNEDFETAAEIGKLQVKKGAQIIDVCLGNPDRNEVDDTIKFYSLITKKVRVPLMIDSTDPPSIESALRRTQGKCIINSLNFEDGTKRIDEVLPLIKKYGSVVIFGTIDEDKKQAMGLTVNRKVDIAKRAYNYLIKKGIKGEDIIFDALVFPIATGDKNYVDSAVASIDAIKEIKKLFPEVKTVLGVSNVSFGLPPAGREVLNSIYLYHATKAGLDCAIVNSEKLMRYPSISNKEKELAEDLLFNKIKNPITPFVNFFREKKAEKKDIKSLPVNERLKSYIVEGRKDGIIKDLDEALKKSKAIEIINKPLMDGMQEVGRLFNENKLIISEVLQSAESMKTAVSHLETFMSKFYRKKKGKIILATVEGDVHDIGKNLFNTLLTNNGYEVIDLGIKVNSEKLTQACKKYHPDIICLSGLLIKSTQMMEVAVKDLKKAGIKIPLLLGGAALSENFVVKKISPAYGSFVGYAKDAMEGLDLINKLTKKKN